MPQKNVVKQYVEGGYYHVYNRGVEKRNIFLDDQDYRVFLHLLKYYLSSSESLSHPFSSFMGVTVVRPRPLITLKNEVQLIAYCLMPNHFHLLVRQLSIDGMPKLLRKLSTTYAMYFNNRYERVGHLFQGVYKAAFIESDAYLLHVSRYIHLNPRELTGLNPVSYEYSSYEYYLGRKAADWIHPEMVLSLFNPETETTLLRQPTSYREFVENYFEDLKEAVGKLALD